MKNFIIFIFIIILLSIFLYSKFYEEFRKRPLLIDFNKADCENGELMVKIPKCPKIDLVFSLNEDEQSWGITNKLNISISGSSGLKKRPTYFCDSKKPDVVNTVSIHLFDIQYNLGNKNNTRNFPTDHYITVSPVPNSCKGSLILHRRE